MPAGALQGARHVSRVSVSRIRRPYLQNSAVPAIDSRHAELRARGWCAGTSWQVIGRIDFKSSEVRSGSENCSGKCKAAR